MKVAPPLELDMLTPEHKARLEAILSRSSPTGSTVSYVAEMWRYALSQAERSDRDVPVSNACDAIPYMPIDPSSFDLKLSETSHVLDIGCCGGYGAFDFVLRRELRHLAVPALDCVDADADSIRVGIELAAVWAAGRDISFLKADAQALPFDSGRYDLVMARLLLPYVQIETTLGEMSRVLKPGGLALIQTHAAAYYAHGLVRSIRKPQHFFYYLRPILSGGILSITDRQPQSRLLSECALSATTLEKLAKRSGLTSVWTGGFRRKPLVLLKKVVL